MSRLTIDITDRQHQNLKAMAALQGKSIKQFALERLFPSENEDAAWDALKALLVERIEAGLAGEVSNLSFDAIIRQELDGKPAA